uniref:Putative nucleocytoplasmic shuttling protein for mrna cap-binding eif4e n=1 Tax=Culex tarsalis TaxID=7177 RepID=A0A1Q3EV78_CULTA
MVKILNTSSNNNLFFNSEQYNDCSSFLMKADDPPLEELDPAILSCGLPAIVLSDMQQQQQLPALASLRAPKIRYTPGQLQAMRKSALCFRRPVVADDPRIGQFAIWKSANQLKRGCRGPYAGRTATEQTSGGSEDTKEVNPPQEKPPGGVGQQKFHYGRDNGFVGPRFRRNYDFNNRNHHVIVKNYHHQHHYRLQDTVIEEEPEWMAAGPTSRLDTIELRGFDEDVVSPNASLEKASEQRKAPGKHISFYDELHHYEHIVGGAKQRSSSAGNTSSGDVESVATSNGSSPPPARSTPTKGVGDFNNNNLDEERQKLSQQHRDGVNVNNFEQFMKFDSILGTDSGSGNNGAQSGSRFSKWFRRGTNGYNQSTGSNFRQAFLSNNDAFGNNRFNQQQRHFGPQPAAYGNRSFNPSEFYDPQQGHYGDESSTAFKRLVDMVAQNRASNNLLAQQQYLMQLLNKNQQSEILRRMLMKNAVDNVVADSNQQQQQQPQSSTNQPRIPTQQELQFHTQSIMQNALLRKKLQDQRKMLYEQATEPTANPAVQQFVQSVCPNIQRSLSVLSQTAGANQFPAQPPPQANSMFPGGTTAAELSNSLQQMLLSQPQQQQQQGQRGRGRFSKGSSVTWNLN